MWVPHPSRASEGVGNNPALAPTLSLVIQRSAAAHHFLLFAKFSSTAARINSFNAFSFTFSPS